MVLTSAAEKQLVANGWKPAKLFSGLQGSGKTTRAERYCKQKQLEGFKTLIAERFEGDEVWLRRA